MLRWILEVILIILVLWFMARRLVPAKGVRNLTVDQLRDALKDQNKQFIDVRSRGEFNPDHISQFQNMPLNKLKKHAQSLSKDQEVIVICQTGLRSNEACKKLKKMGFTQVANVKGGMSAWKNKRKEEKAKKNM